jgi:rhodanese-related sulfurtransferase
MAIKSAKDLVAAANQAVETLSVEQAKALIEKGQVQLVDVREPEEWAKGGIPGAVHIPRGLLEFLADPSNPAHKPELHSGKKLLLYCASAGRSALAAKTLKDMGFTDVAHIAGGYTAWKNAEDAKPGS